MTLVGEWLLVLTGTTAYRGDAGFSRIGAGLLGRARYCLSNDLYAALKQLQSAMVSARGKRDFYVKSIKKPDT